MDLQRTCPECNLAFEAPAPEDGLLTCPLCDARFPTNPAAPLAAPPPEPAAAAAPPTSGGQLLLGAVAVGAVAFLVGGLVHAYHLFQNVGRKAPDPPPVALAPPPAMPAPAPPAVDPSPPAPAPVPQPARPPAPPLVVKPRPQPPPPVATPAVEPLALRVNRAIDNGLAHLRTEHAQIDEYRNYLGLLGLTLLECGVPRNDPTVQAIARELRARQHTLDRTYELALVILFFDRLRAPGDGAIIATLARRLIDGQDESGAWSYVSPVRKPNYVAPLPSAPGRKQVRPQQLFARGDHSNTQFAILALWVAQRHGAWAPNALQRAARYFHNIQNTDGSWTYTRNVPMWRDSNTCAGLLSLAVERGLLAGQGQGVRPARPPWVSDPAIARALRFLGQSVDQMAKNKALRPRIDAHGDLYYLWSLERVATIFNAPTIGSTPWYPWAAELLLSRQLPDGSWRQGMPGPVDTCFALLILRRTNLMQDLLVAVPGITPRPSVPVTGPLTVTRPGGTTATIPPGPLPEPLGPVVAPAPHGPVGENPHGAPKTHQNP